MSELSYARLAELEAEGAPAALVTLVAVNGSTPRSAGARMIVYADGRIEGTVGGGQVEFRAIEEAKEVLQEGQARFVEHHLTQELGMCCGGSVRLFIDLIQARPRLVVFGAGHVGAALCRLASGAGFAVDMVDERESWLSKTRLPNARRLYNDVAHPEIAAGPGVYFMVTTHDHALDQRIVERLMRFEYRWLGLIGSRRKAEVTKKRLAHKGLDETRIASLRCPAGLAIGAETPEEIALSITAEIVALRRKVQVVAEQPQLETKSKTA